jgi:hypothetical protein
VLQDLREERRGGAQLAALQGGLGLRQGLLQGVGALVGAGRLGEAFDEGLDLALRQPTKPSTGRPWKKA